jgi:predicted DNA-binding transcriptional regulator AlpA
MAKQFITIPEFALLFNCSRGHVDKLLDQAQQPTCKYPLPYVDLNGLIQFDRLEVLEWARLRKPFDRKRRKTGGKKKR